MQFVSILAMRTLQAGVHFILECVRNALRRDEKAGRQILQETYFVGQVFLHIQASGSP